MVRDDRVRSHPIHDTCSYDSRMNTHTHTYRERERETERKKQYVYFYMAEMNE